MPPAAESGSAHSTGFCPTYLFRHPAKEKGSPSRRYCGGVVPGCGAGLWTRFLVDFGLVDGPSSTTVLVAAGGGVAAAARGAQMHHFCILRL